MHHTKPIANNKCPLPLLTGDKWFTSLARAFWSQRKSVRAKLRLMMKRILRKYKYSPDQQEDAIQTVLQQAESLSAEWS